MEWTDRRAQSQERLRSPAKVHRTQLRMRSPLREVHVLRFFASRTDCAGRRHANAASWATIGHHGGLGLVGTQQTR